ncbi:MAG: hypothetical protein NVS4B9_36350 [Ktedonobacteraceae bacterium]
MSTKFAGYSPQFWLNNTHIYVTAEFFSEPNAPSLLNLYLLDINKGANQKLTDLQVVVKGLPASCIDMSHSFDSNKLAISQCHEESSQASGPSSIIVQPAIGGTARTIYHTQTMIIRSIRMISSSTLLFTMDDAGNFHTGKDGLWKINIDGSRLTHLTTYTQVPGMFNPFSNSPWGTVSRDGTMYAFIEFGLVFGSFNGGPAKTLTSSAALVGWTTM